jgi:hypothetical protein
MAGSVLEDQRLDPLCTTSPDRAMPLAAARILCSKPPALVLADVNPGLSTVFGP